MGQLLTTFVVAAQGGLHDQQLIKLAYFSTNTSDKPLNVSQEIWLSLQMERQFTKQEILTFYINKVYMGNGYYGMKTAAKSYFGKDLSDLCCPSSSSCWYSTSTNTI